MPCQRVFSAQSFCKLRISVSRLLMVCSCSGLERR
ncbi:Uncharacterised protein [Bordetella pertussis]|nr:Uncharacterised protein [Bordetella pertussis]